MLDVPNNRRFLPASPWTDERTELLKKLWANGLSCSQIATELGSTTRNAVISKLHRIGLDDDDREKPARAPRARRQNDGGALAQRITKMLKVRQPSRGGVAMVSTVVRDEGPVPAEFLGIAFLDLGRDHCRMPRGEGADIRFCGQERIAGKPYCAGCCGLAYDSIRSHASAVRASTAIAQRKAFGT